MGVDPAIHSDGTPSTAPVSLTALYYLKQILEQTIASVGGISDVNIQQVAGEDVVPEEPAAVTPFTTTGMTLTRAALTTSAVSVIATNAVRRNVYVRANVDWYYGLTSGVTTSNGFLTYAGERVNFEGHVGAIYGILATGTGIAYVDERTD
jgi:hypothetical protein